MKKKWIEKFNWVKENLSLILIIPTTIGGLWQLLELSRISTAYIRFFSISQVIPDGLLVLFILSLIFGSYYLATLLIKATPFYKSKLSNWKLSVFCAFFLLAVTSFTGYEIYNDVVEKGYIGISYISLIVFMTTFLLSSLFHLIPYSLKIRFIENRNEEAGKDSKRGIESWSDFFEAMLVCGFLSLAVFIFITTMNVFGDLRNSYIQTDNLINLDNFKQEVSELEKDKMFDKILYFNDKYFFVQFKDRNKETHIRVLKTETIFNAE